MSHRTRQRLLLFVGVLGLAVLMLSLFGGPSGSAHAANSANEPLSADERILMDQVSGYLNGLEHLQGAFLQVAPGGGLSEGQFYLRRPGRLRFEYQPPTELLVVADGTWVTIQEEGFGAPQRYPISATPLSLLLEPDVDLKRDAKILKVERRPGLLQITLAATDEETPGELTLVFDDPSLQLRQWVIKDAQGLQTTIALRNVQTGIRADNALFTVGDTLKPVIGLGGGKARR